MTRLLVIEDEAPLRQTIINTLQLTGYEVIGASNGATGLQLANTYPPDLVISDIRMPELDGYGVLQALRSNPITAAVPLIFLTAKTEREDLRYGMALGADDYIPKPFTLQELVTAVETRLTKRALYIDLQQRLLEVSKSEQLKSDMILIAAHDLRNPITSIRVALHVLKRKYGDAYLEANFTELNNIATAALRMEDITTNILSLERIQTLARNEATQPVNLNSLVEKCCHDLWNQAQQKEIMLECDLAASSIIVLGDPFQLQEASHNLLVNAIKYTPVGGRVTIRLDRIDKKSLLLVEDTGPGVPASEVHRLFEPFHRVRTSETSVVDGTGLGLHLVKNIIERHHGQVFVESVYGEGSVFGFFLPIYDPAAWPLEPVDETSPGVRLGFIHRLIGRIKSL